MRQYIHTIALVQKALLGIGIIILMVLPLGILFYPDFVWSHSESLYMVVHITLLFVMLIRPLADIFTSTRLIRPLVTLRKGFGVVSASIVVSFILAKFIADPVGYLSAYGTLKYWSLTNGVLFAHLADITAVILLITSNVFSKRVMGAWWKRVQRLSYVYFYASMCFVYIAYDEAIAPYAILSVTLLTAIAFVANQLRTTPSVPVTPTKI